MKLSELVESYLLLKQSLGMRFGAEGRVLRAFSKALGDIDVLEVGKPQVLTYINGEGPVTIFWHRKFEALTGFYRFALSRGHLAESPLPTCVPKRPKAFVPYIYTTEEIRTLLEGAPKVCAHQKCPMVADTFQILLLLLWGTGLRISEALQLTVADVDLLSDLLTIRDTKFFKTRFVPIDPELSKVLSRYAKTQKRRTPPDGESPFFFSTREGTSLSLSSVERYFRKLCKSVGVVRKDGARYQPRLHDIRHAFATNRVLSWYQNGENVQVLLPSLSTYLGHATLAATQRYLTAIPEVLREACNRFEEYALEVNHDKS